MLRTVKLIHFGGLAMFLGSILVFVVIAALLEGAPLQSIAFGRKIIDSGTRTLTLPGLWLLATSGVYLGYRRYGVKQRFFQLKLLLIALIVANTYLFIAPAESAAVDLAFRSLARGELLPDYRAAATRESVFGAVNILLTLSAVAIGVWKVGPSSPHRPPALTRSTIM